MAGFIDSAYFTRLVKFAKGFIGGFFLGIAGIKFQGGVELSDGLVFLVEALRHLSEEEVGFGIVWDSFDGVFAAQVSGVEVALVAVEAGYFEIFLKPFIVGLRLLNLGELAAGIDAVAAGVFERRAVRVGRLVGVGLIGVGLIRAGGRRGTAA
jgi:hypothetical protein